MGHRVGGALRSHQGRHNSARVLPEEALSRGEGYNKGVTAGRDVTRRGGASKGGCVVEWGMKWCVEWRQSKGRVVTTRRQIVYRRGMQVNGK